MIATAAGVRADVRLAPAFVGPAVLSVRLRDAHGAPVAARVSAHVDMATMAMTAPGFRRLAPAAAGTYVERLRIEMPGHWHVEVRVERSGSAPLRFDVPVFIDIR